MPMNSIDATTAKTWLDRNTAILVDVREPAENAAERIPGAHLLPLSQVTAHSLANAESKKIIIHCRSGHRSQKACELLATQNPALDLYNLEGGIIAWKQANLPTHSANGLHLALDQQVQVAIGGGVLLGILLGYTISPYFLWLSAFFGLGLLYAGLTGQCALATALARMPWNR